MTWWQDFFDASYLELWGPVLGPERTEWELRGLETLCGGAEGLRIIDVCGGHGRIARPLAARGHRVVVLDYALDMLRHGRAAEHGENVLFVRADARALPMLACADLALNLFTSIGYFPTLAEHHAMLGGIARALRPGAALIMDLVHRDFLACGMAPQTWYTLADATPVLRTFSFDPISAMATESVRALYPNGDVHRQWRLRIFSATEINDALHDAGFSSTLFFDGYDLGDFAADSPRLLVLAERSGLPPDEGPTWPSPLTWRNAATLFVCPRNLEALHCASDAELSQINDAIAHGTLGGQEALLPLECVQGAWLREDRRLFYPVREEIPDLLPESAIALPKDFFGERPESPANNR